MQKVSRHRISYKSLPAKLPLWPTITLGLLLDRTQAPEWLWGVCMTFLLILWVLGIITMFTQKLIVIDLSKIPKEEE